MPLILIAGVIAIIFAVSYERPEPEWQCDATTGAKFFVPNDVEYHCEWDTHLRCEWRIPDDDLLEGS